MKYPMRNNIFMLEAQAATTIQNWSQITHFRQVQNQELIIKQKFPKRNNTLKVFRLWCTISNRNTRIKLPVNILVNILTLK